MQTSKFGNYLNIRELVPERNLVLESDKILWGDTPYR